LDTAEHTASPGKRNGPCIVRIELTPLFVPFHSFVQEVMRAAGGLGMAIPAEEAWTGGDFVICRLTAEDGSTGLGEVFVWLPETGVSPSQVICVIEEALGRYLLGESPFNIERIRRSMEINVARNEVAKGLLDMACYDLMGRITGLPACDFMGGRTVERVPLAALIPLADEESMANMARFFYEDGIRTFRLKLAGSITGDAALVEKVRLAVGSEARIRVDYNQSCREAATAVRAIKAIEPFGIELVEQPLRLYDYAGMAEVQKRVDTPLMAHEDCFSLQDIVTLIEMKAVGAIGLNPERPGGITAALRALDYAERRGLGAVLHNQPLGINSAAMIHLAAARHHQLGYATELFGHVMLEDDLISVPLDYSGGTAAVPAGPGWGVDLDEEALEKYAVGPTIVLEQA